MWVRQISWTSWRYFKSQSNEKLEGSLRPNSPLKNDFKVDAFVWLEPRSHLPLSDAVEKGTFTPRSIECWNKHLKGIGEAAVTTDTSFKWLVAGGYVYKIERVEVKNQTEAGLRLEVVLLSGETRERMRQQLELEPE